MSHSNQLPPEADETDSSLPRALADALLPAHDVAPELAERIRQRAHLLLRERRQGGKQPLGSAWALSYHRLVEPAVLIGLGLWQLVWTVQDTVALFH